MRNPMLPSVVLFYSVVALVLAWSAVFLFYDVERAIAVLKPGQGFLSFRGRELRRLLTVSVPAL